MRKRPTLVIAFRQQAKLFPIYLSIHADFQPLPILMAHFFEGSKSLEDYAWQFRITTLMHSPVSSLQVTRRGCASFPLFPRIASCRKLQPRTGTARPLLLFLARMVISTCAGLHPKSRTTYAGTRPWHPPMCLRCGNTTCGRFVFTLAVECCPSLRTPPLRAKTALKWTFPRCPPNHVRRQS